MCIYVYVYACEHVYNDGRIQRFLNHSLIFFHRGCFTEFGVCEVSRMTGQPDPGIPPLSLLIYC